MVNTKSNTADQIWVRKMNRAIILEIFRTQKTLSRAKLAVETGLNPSTVSSIISDLIEENFIRETDWIQPVTGRPGRLLEINPSGGCALGLEINVDYIEILLTDFGVNILWRLRQSTNPQDNQERIFEQVNEMIQSALSEIQKHQLKLLGAGVGVPGVVDVAKGWLKIAPNLRWTNVPIREMLERQLNCPIYIENEANAAALGEYYFGVTRNIRNFIYLSAGVGLGSGIIIDGKLFRGMSGFAGEAGHMTLDVNGELCSCGKYGCWETFVGPRAVEKHVQTSIKSGAHSLLEQMAGGDLNKISFDLVLDAATRGDQTSIEALKKVGFYLGVGIANLVNLFDVEVIVLGGALNKASSFILSDIESAVSKNVLAPGRESLSIVPSAHGSEACVMGAIALVLDDILREPSLN